MHYTFTYYFTYEYVVFETDISHIRHSYGYSYDRGQSFSTGSTMLIKQAIVAVFAVSTFAGGDPRSRWITGKVPVDEVADDLENECHRVRSPSQHDRVR